jgi:hypothetical protein
MLVVALVFAVGIAVSAVQNTAPVEVAFLVWRAQGVAASPPHRWTSGHWKRSPRPFAT